MDGLIGQTGDILGHNMYAYCKNNPVMKVDPSGYDSQAIFSWGMKIAAFLAVIDGPLPAGDTIAEVVLTATVVIGAGYLIYENWDDIVEGDDQLAKNVSSSLKSKVSTREKKPFEYHHIVAQDEPGAFPAKDILNKVGIGINSPQNIIILEYDFHRHLHTDLYYATVNLTLQSAFIEGDSEFANRVRVEAALMELRFRIMIGDIVF